MQQGRPSGATPLDSKKLTGAAAWLSPNRPPERDGRGHSDPLRRGLAVTTVCEVGHSVIYLTLSLLASQRARQNSRGAGGVLAGV